MTGIKQYFYRWTIGLQALLLCAGCADEMQHIGSADAVSEGLVLNLSVNNSRVDTATGAPDAGLCEDVVKRVDVFFVQSDGTVKGYCHSEAGNAGTFSLSGEGWTASNWQDFFTDASYDVYVIANKHDYDNPATSEKETDLSWVKTKTQLLALTDTDVNVAKTEGETAVVDDAKFTGKDFLMDGYYQWNISAEEKNTGEVSIPVNLSHAAAKISVNISYTDAFLIEGRTINSVQKKLVRYAEQAKAVALGGDIVLVDLHGDAGGDSFSYADVSEGEGVNRTDKVYTYSYPNDWSEDVEARETYVLLNIPYTDGDTDALTNNYYKIPVRVSAATGHLSLERNMEYRVKVTVDRVGNTSPEEPVVLDNQEVTVEPWRVKDIPITDATPQYLVLSDYDFEMRNIAEATVTFSSSSPLESVTATKVYFVNKYGVEIGYGVEDLTQTNLIDKVTVDFDEDKLNGNIYVNSVIPDNVTIRYIELEVKNTEGLTKTINIAQYPLEYIVGIPGVFGHRDDMNNMNYIIFRDNIKFSTSDYNNKPTCWLSFGEEYLYYYSAKVFKKEDKTIRNLRARSLYGQYDVIINTKTGTDMDAGKVYGSNNRMYLVNVTSVKEGVTISRPEMETDSEYPVPTEENNNVVSPVFMLASQLGVIDWGTEGEWEATRIHCARYVETIEYSDGTIRELNDWRLPSSAEIAIIAKYQTATPDVMDMVMTAQYYWSLQEDTKVELPYYEEYDKDETFVRCVRDVTPADLEEFRKNGFKI